MGETGENDPVTGQDLRRLGYKKGRIDKSVNSITYEQGGWGGFKYQVNVRWKQKGETLEGCWSINSEFPGWVKQISAEKQTAAAMSDGLDRQFHKHLKVWENFWAQSDITVPESVLNKQWYLEMYKF